MKAIRKSSTRTQDPLSRCSEVMVALSVCSIVSLAFNFHPLAQDPPFSLPPSSSSFLLPPYGKSLSSLLRKSQGVSKKGCLRRSVRKILERRCICLRACLRKASYMFDVCDWSSTLTRNSCRCTTKLVSQLIQFPS